MGLERRLQGRDCNGVMSLGMGSLLLLQSHPLPLGSALGNGVAPRAASHSRLFHIQSREAGVASGGGTPGWGRAPAPPTRAAKCLSRRVFQWESLGPKRIDHEVSCVAHTGHLASGLSQKAEGRPLGAGNDPASLRQSV